MKDGQREDLGAGFECGQRGSLFPMMQVPFPDGYGCTIHLGLPYVLWNFLPCPPNTLAYAESDAGGRTTNSLDCTYDNNDVVTKLHQNS